jgi:hypothetical protein
VVDQEATYLATLLDVITAIELGHMRSSIAASVLEVIHDRLGLYYGDVRVVDGERELHTLATLHAHTTLPPSRTPYELGRQAIYEHRVMTGRSGEETEGPGPEGVRHVSIPFDICAESSGVMDLSFRGSRRFTPDEMELFGAIGRLLAIAFAESPDAGNTS